MNARWVRRMMNCWPPFIGAGIRVRHIADDYSEALIEMRFRWYNRNYVGTHFGGSLYSMTDPFHMVLAMARLGQDYVVWDKAGSIEYVAPGRGKVFVRISVDDAQLADIRARARGGAKVLPEFTAVVTDAAGSVVARITKTLYVRLKRTNAAASGREHSSDEPTRSKAAVDAGSSERTTS